MIFFTFLHDGIDFDYFHIFFPIYSLLHPSVFRKIIWCTNIICLCLFKLFCVGFYSWRNTTRGSWFVQALCAELEENSFYYDILTLLTFVNRRVATEFESNTPHDSMMHARKQIPSISSMLTRLVKFSPPKKLN